MPDPDKEWQDEAWAQVKTDAAITRHEVDMLVEAVKTADAEKARQVAELIGAVMRDIGALIRFIREVIL